MKKRPSYPAKLYVNGREINEIIIDSHYQEKHPDVNDLLILELVQKLDGKEWDPSETKDEWDFFMLDKIPHKGKFYRLVWCMKDSCLFIGVINCFRR